MPKIFRTIILSFLVIASIALFQKSHALTIEDIRFGLHPDKTRLVLELDSVSDYRVFTLSDPYRIVIDLPRFSKEVDSQARLSSLKSSVPVKDIRWGHLNPAISRLVLDLKNPVLISNAFLIPPRQSFPARLVLDFRSSSAQQAFKQLGSVFGTLTINDIQAAAAKTDMKGQAEKKTSFIAPSNKPRKKRPVIIIDPGHGGIDPGAIAANGVHEKDIVLKLSHEIRRQLIETRRFDVRMTREDDRFLRLRDRVAFARRHKGDLFLSIHADSLNKSYVSGASVYTLSEKASDAQTARLAKRENRADLIAGVDLATEGQEVANILIDLAMRDTMNQSAFFANTLVTTMQNGRINTLENPHRYAGFAVLKAPDIPSVLVEAGFLSNRREAEQLSKASYRRAVARTIVDGIMKYYDKVEQNKRS